MIFQFWVSHSITEPYPAILFPAFSEAPKDQSTYYYKIPKIVLFKGEREIPVKSEQLLFNTVPPVYASTLIRKLFSESSYLFDLNPDVSTPKFSIGPYNYFIDGYSVKKQRKRSGKETATLEKYFNITFSEFHENTKVDSIRVHWLGIEINLKNETRDTSRLHQFTLAF